MPDCAGVGSPRVLLEKQGMLESVAFDASGRLLFTSIWQKVLKRLDRPDATPVTVAEGLNAPGGIAVVNAHEAYVGTGNSVNGLLPVLGQGGIAHVDLDSGAVTPFVKGLAMANGLVRTQAGVFYASDDLAKSLDRVLANGTVQRTWLKQNSNGLALSRDEQTLYVNQFLPAAILAVDLATGSVRTHAVVPAERRWTGLDGLAIDDAGRLYVVAYFSGEIWRVARDGQLCRLAQGLSAPSSVVVGRSGQGYAPTSIYVATHSGRLHEVPNAVPAEP